MIWTIYVKKERGKGKEAEKMQKQFRFHSASLPMPPQKKGKFDRAKKPIQINFLLYQEKNSESLVEEPCY